jgi:arylsulfatase A-like enzyme
LAYSDRAAPNHARRYKEWRAAFAGMSQAERNRTTLRYYANCSWLDHYFGIVIERLRKLGRLDNAIVVYTSDHGEMLGERNYRFTKYCLYESAVRVPLILSGGALPAALRGRADDRPAELCDLYPTLARVAGVRPKAALPGADLLAPPAKSGSFCEYHDSGSPAYMWRNREWKLILFADRPVEQARAALAETRGELYDLRQDPHEWRNLYPDPEHAAIRERMKTELAMHLASAWSGFPASARP